MRSWLGAQSAGHRVASRLLRPERKPLRCRQSSGSDESTTNSRADPYVYWVDGDELIIVRQSTAEALVSYDEILATSKTFGEYVARCRAAGGTVIEQWVGSFDDSAEWDFEDDERFDLDQLPGYGDGSLRRIRAP